MSREARSPRRGACSQYDVPGIGDTCLTTLGGGEEERCRAESLAHEGHTAVASVLLGWLWQPAAQSLESTQRSAQGL